MPVKETSDSEQAPAGRSKQRSSLLRVVVVVGLPLLSVVLRLPMWFTLLLMVGLAAFLFFNFNLQRPQRREADPKRAWAVLMASFVQLQNAHATLKRSPADPSAHKRFLTCEQVCLSLLSSHSDADWGRDAEYAVKVRDEIAAISAAARAECAQLVPAPGQGVKPPAEAGRQTPASGNGATAPQPVSPASPTPSGIPNHIEALDLAPASMAAAAQPVTPVPPAQPQVPAPVERHVAVAASETAAVQSVTSASPAEPEVPSAAREHGLTPASEAAPVQPVAPAPPATPEVPAPAATVEAVAASEAAVVQPVVPTPPAEPEVPVAAVKESVVAAAEAVAVQPATPVAAPAEPEVPSAAREHGLMPASEVAPVQPVAPAPPATPEVSAPVATVEAVAASEAPVVQPVVPTPPAEPEVPVAAVKESVVAAAAAVAVQPATPVAAPAEPEVPSAAKEQGSAPASENAAVKPEGFSSSATLDVSRPAVRRLTPFLWLSGGVEDAAAFYVSVFKNSRIVSISGNPEGSHAGAWGVKTATVCLDGQDLMLLGGGPVYRAPETFQSLVRCADQAEVDYYWERLLAGGGEEKAGGWLKDRFGVSWQVMPDALMELLVDPDPQRVARATEAMMKMKRIDMAKVREAVGRL